MKFLHLIVDGLSRWIDCVAAAILAARGWFVSPRKVTFVEGAPGVFAVHAGAALASGAETAQVEISGDKVVGALPANLAANLKASHAELILAPDRFMFRPLELPRRASEFLDGIVRAQIDRLTPWSAGEAAFGFTAPTESGVDRIVVTVAATARAQIAALVAGVATLGPGSIVVSTTVPGAASGTAISVFEQRTRSVLEASRIRRGLMAVLIIAGLLAGAAGAGVMIIGGDLDAQQDSLTRRIATWRSSMRLGQNAARDTSLAALERRKHEIPSSVIVIEALSQLLPDHTYVTELRIVGDKLQVVGMTRDAPSLIRLIEQSQHFTRATFFAPTTRSPSDTGEQFHIEARIEPVYTPRT